MAFGINSMSALLVRNFVFGIEDSLVSTVGLLSGVAVAAVPRETIILIGVVLILVEAFSMAVGSFLSEQSTEEYVRQGAMSYRGSLAGGMIMFFSYFAAGFIPLSPYFFLPSRAALSLSIAASLAALFLLGVVGAKLSRLSAFKGGLRMCSIGGIAILAGIIVGGFFPVF